MNKMPYEIKNKLRRLAKAYQKAGNLENEVCDMIESYEVNIGYLNGTDYDIYSRKPKTEALAYIINSEEDVEASIKEIEEVFLWHVNYNKK